MGKYVKNGILLFFLVTGILCTPVTGYAGEDAEKAPVYGSGIRDGVYEVQMESSSSMFRIVKAELTVKDGSMTAVLTLSGTGYLKLFMGTGAEAQKAGEERYIPYVEDAEGAYTYTIPVEALNVEFPCAAYSRRKERWYDRQLAVLASSLPEEALLEEGLTDEPLPEEGPSEEGLPEKGLTDETLPEKGLSEKGLADETLPEEGLADETLPEEGPSEEGLPAEPGENSGPAPVQVQEDDGAYTMEVTLSGGTGRAFVASPARVQISGGTMAAYLEWSSPDYDYMTVGGTRYFPVNAQGNSVFEIPVPALDQEVDITADTTAMSKPHEIAYTLTFHSDTLRKQDGGGHGTGAVFPGAAAAAAAAALVLIFMQKRRKKAGHG